MSTFGKLAIVQTKLYIREPIALFFTMLYGPVILLLIGFIFGNEPQAIFQGLGQIDVSVPSYMAMVIGITGMTAIPIGAATRRETGVLRRFSATPLRPLMYFLTDILAPFIVSLLGVAILILLGFLVFHVRFSGSWLNVAAAICLSLLSFFSLGYAIAGIVPNARTAVIVGNLVIIPMVIFSGAQIPLEVMPETVKNISRFVPLTHAVSLLRGLWFGETWGDHLLELAVLGGIIVLGMVIVALTFKWE
jgi:ABC-2 type transport system permease protein